MRFEEWEPVYHEICEYFSFDPTDDENAAQIAAGLSSADDSISLDRLIRGRTITICGNAPGLRDELDQLDGVVIAADAAAAVLIEAGIRPDIIVTDLDGIDDYAIKLNQNGVFLVVHAHGDNIPRLQYWIPRFTGPLVLTTQGRPFANIYNFGGFSDGDRSVYMAQACGASLIKIIGFNCDDPDVTPVKLGKLIWARKLLARIGYDC